MVFKSRDVLKLNNDTLYLFSSAIFNFPVQNYAYKYNKQLSISVYHFLYSLLNGLKWDIYIELLDPYLLQALLF